MTCSVCARVRVCLYVCACCQWGIPEYNAFTDTHASHAAQKLLGNAKSVKRLRKAGVVRRGGDGDVCVVVFLAQRCHVSVCLIVSCGTMP